MRHKLLQLVHGLFQAGIRPAMDQNLAKKIRVMNAMCVFLAAITLPYSLIFTWMGSFLLGGLIVPIAISYLVCIYFNNKGKYFLSRLSFLTQFNTAVTLYSWALGIDSRIHLLFFPLACLPFTIFELKDKWSLVWSSCLPIVLCMHIIYKLPGPIIGLDQGMASYIPYFLIPTTFAILISSVIYLQRENERVEKDLGDALAARSSETERFHQILDAITDMIILKDDSLHVLWGNLAFRDYFSVSTRDIEEPHSASRTHIDFTQEFIADDRRVIASGKPLTIASEHISRHDGSSRVFNTIKVPLKDIGGKPTMLVAVCRDVTDQLEAERIIAEQRSQMVASAKLSALGEMAAGISHEINNPLAIISCRASNLMRTVERSPEKVQQLSQFAQDIIDTTLRIAKIIRGLQSFARSGDEDPFTMSSLEEIVEDTLELCRARMKNHGVQLEVAFSQAGNPLQCRPVQISQILLNLIANAFDAVEEAPERWIRINIERQHQGYAIAVTDSGKGVSKENQEKIFQPFFTTKAFGKGTGLGLSITRGIVADHNGTIRISQQSKNTCFELWLPEAQPSADGVRLRDGA